MAGPFEIRDPIHGFIELDDWERDIVNHPVFQRLRRIRQLGLTDMVYPGATHSRFEHSLGVMHVATRMFEAIVDRRRDFLRAAYKYDDAGLARDKRILRLAALLHDVGHAPFSHGGEGLMPEIEKDRQFGHEQYSAAIVANLMRDVIESHPLNQNHEIKAQDIADFLEGKASVGRRLLWANLVDGQLDADRADYLLRDSHHIGVTYGHFDLQRLLTTLTVVEDSDRGSPALAVEEGGLHAAEGLIIARYMMFTQVYFHRVRRAYDRHLAGALRMLLEQSGGFFPPPIGEKNLGEFIEWEDWRVLGRLASRDGGSDGEIIRSRNHDRCVFETPESPELKDRELLAEIRVELADRISFVDTAEKSLYKFDNSEVWILRDARRGTDSVDSLSNLSSVVRGLRAVNQRRLYVPMAQRDHCRKVVERLTGNRESFK